MAGLKQGQGEHKKGFFARWFESIAESRMRQVEHEMKLHEQQHPWMKDGDEKQREDTKH